MKLRTRAAAVLAALAAALCPAAATAAGAPPQGYVRLDRPQAVDRPGGREAVEFFWYDCRHSQRLERPLAAWAARQPRDVRLRRVPAVWPGGDRVMTAHARLYYTLERLGLVDRLQAAAFHAVRDLHRDLTTEASAAAWAREQGVDGARFRRAYASAEVRRETREAPALMARYAVPELPSVVVQGRYRTAPTLAGGVEGMVPVVDRLVRRAAPRR
ncbi:thiol:disulfide interchange protein DsbA/DsbL [Streptacidiphilus sp. ASG 303]|uniref:thiol:disulfide interchange protein DsbA/DsbL n=1 Tax=Streptacidiphilus sp. ASG 303 TaxID=2896847 RepID=UPI001E462556|nr:thiol:disulfide interchange protein DsbA/DsbL [Streptacidiphilus sp. ASG 303]MCD0484463.1 thiol:disulfide interchange protein DsbA/DsbL [Streptacidiphilus sp. ASG 303]